MIKKSEEVLGETWAHCAADTLIKLGAGIAVGGVLSVIVFRKKMWPVTFSTGIGLGMGLANCQHALNEPHLAKMQHFKLKEKEPSVKEKESPVNEKKDT